MVIFVTVIHILVCFFLILVILLQSGTAGDVAAAFGGMGSQTAFGPRGGATVMTKATTWAAVIFILTSVYLSVMGTRHRSGSALEKLAPATKTSQPAKAPASQPPQPEPQPLNPR